MSQPEHTYNQHSKPTRCGCSGRPMDVVHSFPNHIDIVCQSCKTVLGYWRNDRFYKPDELEIE